VFVICVWSGCFQVTTISRLNQGCYFRPGYDKHVFVDICWYKRSDETNLILISLRYPAVLRLVVQLKGKKFANYIEQTGGKRCWLRESFTTRLHSFILRAYNVDRRCHHWQATARLDDQDTSALGVCSLLYKFAVTVHRKCSIITRFI